MFMHLGNNAITLLLHLFNLCLEKHQWVWECAEVIFLRKDGKSSYSKPGSYRPICITAYIGKLFEKIIAKRIEELLISNDTTDPDQEGFSSAKNTIRYLNRLHLGIKSDIESNLTVLGLFVDFEKAFDSVWKRGLIVKLFNTGIRGNILKLINHFLFSRKVAINVNGFRGEFRHGAEYGLPQGSALSPTLFKIYVSDFLSDHNNDKDLVLYKFADDGTVKITAKHSEQCLQKLDYVLCNLHNWSKKWRMNINCDRNKTEIICFNTSENNQDLIPNSFKLGNSEIFRVSETKVLGLVIDEHLNYTSHSQKVLKGMHNTWSTLCKYSNRHWGFTQEVMLRLVITLILSKISYASHIWVTKENLIEINKLWYHILKSIIGAVFNLNQDVAEIILGVPPLTIQFKVNSIKHFLKLNINFVPRDRYKEFIHDTYTEETKSPQILHQKLKDVFMFLTWKMNKKPKDFNDADKEIVKGKQYEHFSRLSDTACSYTQNLMKAFTEHLWHETLKLKFQLEGYPTPPYPKCVPPPIPLGISREKEVLLFSLFYKNNLLNNFLWQLSKVPSPICLSCNAEEETADHILFRCNAVEENLQNQVISSYDRANTSDPHVDTYIGLLNACKNPDFVKSALNVLGTMNLRTSIQL